ncbi:TetR family transcriptional regulator [Streptomyces sp. A7024]|uniref:TetR family transcriptional regulator n=1 Tax=Streptomyces coryli TaxID=1128680 RepID=A0A6G4TVV9_9ACTN|nr:TetR/AcrR family transcriptional regulator [Streptomyces coryli]NGN64139.1 TetR family transcriptional regulator [Streptomyces coryli]
MAGPGQHSTSQPSLRERKQARTRQALIEAAVELFERQGYDETTVAEIAAAAEIGTRTFFGYFAGKEDILFPDSDARSRATIAAIADRDPAEGPVDVLLRALDTIAESDADMVSPMAAVRMRLFHTVPAVRGKALQVQLAAQREIARELHKAFPGELDQVTAAALAGALTGAVSGALDVLLGEQGAEHADPAQLQAQVRQATERALRPWRQAAGE